MTHSRCRLQRVLGEMFPSEILIVEIWVSGNIDAEVGLSGGTNYRESSGWKCGDFCVAMKERVSLGRVSVIVHWVAAYTRIWPIVVDWEVLPNRPNTRNINLRILVIRYFGSSVAHGIFAISIYLMNRLLSTRLLPLCGKINFCLRGRRISNMSYYHFIFGTDRCYGLWIG